MPNVLQNVKRALIWYHRECGDTEVPVSLYTAFYSVYVSPEKTWFEPFFKTAETDHIPYGEAHIALEENKDKQT